MTHSINPFAVLEQKLHSIEVMLMDLKFGSQDDNPNYIPLIKAAEFLDKTPNAVRVMVCKNQIKHIKKGGKLYFLKSDLIDYLESGRVENEPTNAVDVLSKKKNL